MITEDYVSFETAKLLKEKGFDEYTFSCYTNDGLISFMEVETRILAGYQRPTLQMAMKWLREVHNLFIGIEYVNIAGLGFTCQAIISKLNDDYDYCICKKSYEDAIESAIKYCLEKLI